MSIISNKGIVLFANGDASSGAIQLSLSGVGLASVLAPNVDTTSSIVISLDFGFSVCTQYVFRVRLKNTNRFGALAGGSAPPATTGGAVNASFIATPLLSVAQNDSAPAFPLLDHTYTQASGVTKDFIELNGPLAGVLDILVTPSGTAVGPADFVLVAVDMY